MDHESHTKENEVCIVIEEDCQNESLRSPSPKELTNDADPNPVMIPPEQTSPQPEPEQQQQQPVEYAEDFEDYDTDESDTEPNQSGAVDEGNNGKQGESECCELQPEEKQVEDVVVAHEQSLLSARLRLHELEGQEGTPEPEPGLIPGMPNSKIPVKMNDRNLVPVPVKSYYNLVDFVRPRSGGDGDYQSHDMMEGIQSHSVSAYAKMRCTHTMRMKPAGHGNGPTSSRAAAIAKWHEQQQQQQQQQRQDPDAVDQHPNFPFPSNKESSTSTSPIQYHDGFYHQFATGQSAATASLTVQVKRCTTDTGTDPGPPGPPVPVQKFSRIKSSTVCKHQQITTRRVINHHYNAAVVVPAKPIGFVQKRVASAKRLQIKDLTSRIRYLEGVAADLRYENRTLKTVHLRQDVALKKYEGAESDLTKLIGKHKSEVHYLQSNLRKAYGQCRDFEDKVRCMTLKLNQLVDEKSHLQELVNQHNLEERNVLAEQLQIMTAHAEALGTRLMEYERHVQVLEKNHKHEIEIENGKIRSLNKKVLDARKEIETMAEVGHQKDRIINYLRMRCGREHDLEGPIAPMVNKMYDRMHEESLARNHQANKYHRRSKVHEDEPCKLIHEALSKQFQEPPTEQHQDQVPLQEERFCMGHDDHDHDHEHQKIQHEDKEGQNLKSKGQKSYRRRQPEQRRSAAMTLVSAKKDVDHLQSRNDSKKDKTCSTPSNEPKCITNLSTEWKSNELEVDLDFEIDMQSQPSLVDDDDVDLEMSYGEDAKEEEKLHPTSGQQKVSMDVDAIDKICAKFAQSRPLPPMKEPNSGRSARSLFSVESGDGGSSRKSLFLEAADSSCNVSSAAWSDESGRKYKHFSSKNSSPIAAAAATSSGQKIPKSGNTSGSIRCRITKEQDFRVPQFAPILPFAIKHNGGNGDGTGDVPSAGSDHMKNKSGSAASLGGKQKLSSAGPGNVSNMNHADLKEKQSSTPSAAHGSDDGMKAQIAATIAQLFEGTNFDEEDKAYCNCRETLMDQDALHTEVLEILNEDRKKPVVHSHTLSEFRFQPNPTPTANTAQQVQVGKPLVQRESTPIRQPIKSRVPVPHRQQIIHTTTPMTNVNVVEASRQVHSQSHHLPQLQKTRNIHQGPTRQDGHGGHGHVIHRKTGTGGAGDAVWK